MNDRPCKGPVVNKKTGLISQRMTEKPGELSNQYQ